MKTWECGAAKLWILNGGCCCCFEDIQIAPLLHYASAHSLNTWTQPPPTLTLGAMVPDSASWGWRMAWVVTLPVVWRMILVTPRPPVCVCVFDCWGTMLFVFLTSLPFVPPSHCNEYKGYCIRSHKEQLFLWAPEASVSPPSLNCLVTPVTTGQRGQEHS